jgi:hypothetical protein
MQSVPKKIFQVLDGTPAVYGHHSRGQSLVELALVTPLLIVLLMGLAEIGWFANNYLILLETTRVGARYGAIQTGDTSPYLWPNAGSLIPSFYASTSPEFVEAQNYRVCSNLDLKPETRRFYNTIVCRMFDAMAPLEFRVPSDPSQPASATNGNGVDDIVVSAFQLQSLNPSDPNIPAAMRSTIDTVTGLPTDQQQVVVVGRFPTNANECTTDTATDKDTRDPFNYINYNVAGYTVGNRNYIVPSGPDVEANRLYYENLGDDSTAELQRGFAFTGQHIISATRNNAAGTKCYGSEWTIDRVEKLMNVSNFNLINNSPESKNQRSVIPSEGLILVEMFWQHTLLLRNPVFNPVFNILNDPSNPNGSGTIISVWAAFPLPSVEPRIKYAVGS